MCMLALVACSVLLSMIRCIGAGEAPHSLLAEIGLVDSMKLTVIASRACPPRRHCPFGHLEVNPEWRPAGSVPKVRGRVRSYIVNHFALFLPSL